MSWTEIERQRWVQELERLENPRDVMKAVFEHFGDRAAIGTSGQLTGIAMMALAVETGLKPRVFTIDTNRLFPETYRYLDKLETHLGLDIERVKPDPNEVREMIEENGEYLFFDSKEKQELCCQVRKVNPNQRILETVDVWFTGLRRDQSQARARTKSRFSWVEHGPDKRPVLKIAPLLEWKEREVREYLKEHRVPIHPLLEWGQDGFYYGSLGCQICTTPVGPFESTRAGRWRWFNDSDSLKECGLHLPAAS